MWPARARAPRDSPPCCRVSGATASLQSIWPPTFPTTRCMPTGSACSRTMRTTSWSSRARPCSTVSPLPRTPRSCAGWSGSSTPRCAMRWSSGTWPMQAQQSTRNKGVTMVMRAAQIHEDLTLGVDSVDMPSPGRGEVLVRIHAAGVCGTDLHILDGMIKPDPYPMTVGHEAAGGVEAIGEGVVMTVGTRVPVYNKLLCGGEPGQLGFNRDGGDADYVVVPERNAVAIPDGVDMATAAVLTCAGMTAVHATKLSGLRIGDTAVVNGIGGVGILVVQAARRAGARVIAVADTPEKMALAQAHGATGGVGLTGADGYASVPEQVRGLSDGRGADVFFELVGTTASMTAGVRTLTKGGRFVSTGYTDQVLTIHPIEFILSETSLVSTVAATLPDLEDALRLAAGGAMGGPIAGPSPPQGISDALTALRQRAVLGRQILELVGSD